MSESRQRTNRVRTNRLKDPSRVVGLGWRLCEVPELVDLVQQSELEETKVSEHLGSGESEADLGHLVDSRVEARVQHVLLRKDPEYKRSEPAKAHHQHRVEHKAKPRTSLLPPSYPSAAA